MRTKPTDSQDGVNIDYSQIDADRHNFDTRDTALSMTERLHHFILHKQSFIKTALTPDKLKGFEAYPNFQQLQDMATHGLMPFTKPTFIPNQGFGDFRRESQHRRLQHTIAQHIRKLQDHGRCFIIERARVQGIKGLHLSALHVASKAADSKGRPCTDAAHSRLNDGTNMDAITTYLGDFKLPQLRTLARLLATAQAQGNTLAHKTDVSAAFNNMILHPTTALLQSFCVGDWVVIPLVAGFGWCAAPAFYHIVAGAIHWAHNGGLTPEQLDIWTAAQGRIPQPRNATLDNRSITYVDDSCGQSSILSAAGDMEDLHTIIAQLLGPAAYNMKKTEGPLSRITIIGWDCDLMTYTIRPSRKGLCKLYFWIFRGLIKTASITLHDLQRAIGTLRWYTAVIPLASTHELQHVLSTCQHFLTTGSTRRPYCSLTAAARRELHWWQWLLATNLHHNVLEAPVWYLAGLPGTRELINLYTDASTTVGGGYYIPTHSYGQFLWSPAEKALFGKDTSPTDINGLEFVAAICAILANRDYLRHKVVRLHVDNTSAVAWLNKQRTSQHFGQSWMRLLISVLLTHDILLQCVHIPGVLNVHADALSRFLQNLATSTLTASLLPRPVLSAMSRLHFWKMSATLRSAEEYHTILTRLETQDSAHLFECASSSNGPSLTSPART